MNDTHMENCVLLNSIQRYIEIDDSLLLTFFICLHDQLISIHSIFICLHDQLISIHSIFIICLQDQLIFIHFIFMAERNEQQLISAIFTANFALTVKNAFSQRFHFKANRKSIGSSTVLGAYKKVLRLRDRHVFFVQSLEIWNVFNT